VNKLKLIKRQGYGRVSFPLLCQRVLHALFIQIDQDEQSPSSFITALPPSCMGHFPTVLKPKGERIHKSNCVIKEFGEKDKREMSVS
jgi:hypothetical protein